MLKFPRRAQQHPTAPKTPTSSSQAGGGTTPLVGRLLHAAHTKQSCSCCNSCDNFTSKTPSCCMHNMVTQAAAAGSAQQFDSGGCCRQRTTNNAEAVARLQAALNGLTQAAAAGSPQSAQQFDSGGCCRQRTTNNAEAARLQAALNGLTQAAATGSSKSAQQFHSDGCNRQRTTHNAVAVVWLQKAHQVYLGCCCRQPTRNNLWAPLEELAHPRRTEGPAPALRQGNVSRGVG
jgi:hypothetical protein